MNNNKPIIDLPIWMQLNFAPANSAAGSSFVEDNERFIYYMINATNFWRYDTYSDTWQQLASPPAGTIAAGSKLIYTKCFGEQLNGVVYGSVFSFQCSGSAVTFYRYNIATNTWSSVLSVTNVPAAFGTDGYISYPSPELNGWEGNYHSGVLRTITASAQAIVGATSISVNALPQALLSGTILNFGTLASPKWAVLTAGAAQNATSISVAALQTQIDNANTAYYYDNMYLIGNNATQIYRYNISGNAWSTTSANSGNPALIALSAAAGAGCSIKFLPGATGYENKLVVIRGGASVNIYVYDLVANTIASLTYYPNTETYTTGTYVSTRNNAAGKQEKLIFQKDATLRIYELDLVTARKTGKATQNVYPGGAALVGDRMAVIKSPDGIEFIYMILHTSNAFLRTGLFF